MRHRIVIQSVTKSYTLGKPSLTWGTHALRWGRVEPLNADEQFAIEQVHAGITHRVALRYTDGITPEMRVRHGIDSADNAVGTATGGGNDYILLADSGTQSDDEFNGNVVILTGGTGSGQARQVLDYDHTANASGERYAQVNANWSTNPDDTTTYMIVDRTLNIAGVRNIDERGAEHELLCREEV